MSLFLYLCDVYRFTKRCELLKNSWGVHVVYIPIFIVVCPPSTRPAGGRNFAWHPSANGQPPPPRGLRCGGSLPFPPGAVMPADHPPTSGVCSHFVRPRTPAMTPLRGCASAGSIPKGGACHLRGRSLASPKSAPFLHSTRFNYTHSAPPWRVPPTASNHLHSVPSGAGFIWQHSACPHIAPSRSAGATL